jgi:hypothetical protein
MKLQEIKTFEHRTGPHVDIASKETQLKWLNAGTRIDNPTGFEGKSAVLFLNKEGPNNHIFVIVEWAKQNEPIGYCVLHKTGKWWEVDDANLDPSFRGKGLMSNVLFTLSKSGYSLKSGDLLSEDMERVWQTLGKEGAKVLDAESGKLKSFDNSPIGSGDLISGIPPKYYWVMEGEGASTLFHTGGADKLAECKDYYLSGGQYGTNGTLGLKVILLYASA